MGRISRGFHLLKLSWRTLAQDKELMLLPLYSLLGVLVVVGASAGIAAGAGWLREEGQSPGLALLGFVTYFLVYAIGIFFNAAVVAAATIRLQGGDPTVADGLRAAWGKRGKILGWAAIAATVGVILKALEDKAGAIGKFVIGLIGVAWSLVTFFVVPVLLFEPETVTGSLKRSASLFKQRWGEQFVGSGSIGLALFLLSLPVLLVAGLLVTAVPVLGIVVAVLALGTLSMVGAALSGVFNAALYRYATTGEGVGEFSADDLGRSFRRK